MARAAKKRPARKSAKKRSTKKASAKKPVSKKPAAANKSAATQKSGRRVIYSVAMSLDGYIAGPKGEFDWIVTDPDIDFGEMWSAFDTLLIGRRTFEVMASQGQGSSPGMTTVVFSTTLRQSDYPDVQVVSEDIAGTVKKLKTQPGKDIWLFGGGELFRSLLDAGVVDAVGVAVVPVVLGGGIPFLASPATQTKLRLRKHKLYPKTGIMLLEYDVV